MEEFENRGPESHLLRIHSAYDEYDTSMLVIFPRFDAVRNSRLKHRAVFERYSTADLSRDYYLIENEPKVGTISF